MGVDTYLIVPSRTPTQTLKLLREEPEFELELEASQLGVDFVALYEGTAFAEVQQDPLRWGLSYHDQLPASIRRQLDLRGLLIVAEVGQSFEGVARKDLERDGVWLPVKRKPVAGRKNYVMFVPLSANQEQHLLTRPKLAREIVNGRKTKPVPGSLEVSEDWLALQEAALELQRAQGSGHTETVSLIPTAGMPLFEDEVIQSARLVRAQVAPDVAASVLALPDAGELDRLKTFYRALLKQKKGLLTIRFLA